MFQRQGIFGATPVTLRGGAPAGFGNGMGAFSHGAFQIGQGPGAPAPAPAPRVVPQADPAWTSGDKMTRLVGRLCSILGKFSERQIDQAAAASIFWSYVDDAKVPDDVVTKQVSANCPGLTVPPRTAATVRVDAKASQKGFHGKTQITFQEAKELFDLLTTVIAPLTPEEAASEIADRECLREMTQAGGFPIVERLHTRLEAFLATAQPSDSFEISHGEANVTGKAVECAEALGRIKTVRTALTVGGVAAGGGALLLLLGVL